MTRRVPNARARRFRRPLGNRPYRRLFVVATEGAKTEPEYFALFNTELSCVQVHCLRRGNHSAPRAVLGRMRAYLRNQGLKASDQAWLLVDKDQWTEDQLTELHAWSKSSEKFGFALSNPSFEYWLLLHFEDGEGLLPVRDYSDRLRRHCPRFDKGVGALNVSDAHIRAAIRRAKRRDTPPCDDWPRALGGTTVYRLVDRMVSPGTP